MSGDEALFDHWNMADDDSLDSLRHFASPFRRSGSKRMNVFTQIAGKTAESRRPDSPHSAVIDDFTMGIGGDEDSPSLDSTTSSTIYAGSTRAGLPSVEASACMSRRRGAALPRLGDEVGGFRLMLELGRGAFARVFLAEETNLGNRLVALKISKAEGDEPQILARLQHANIVPVHSVHDDPSTGLRLLCMPFLGGANLAQVLQETCGTAGARATGRGMVEALDQLSQRLPAGVGDSLSLSRRSSRPSQGRSSSKSIGSQNLRYDQPTTSVGANPISDAATVPQEAPVSRFATLRWLVGRIGGSVTSPGEDRAEDELLPSRRFLRGADTVRASVWIVARLAEGLEHAHARGLLHRDLKPSNVLIAADGTPMLLDFNLSVEANPDVEHVDESIRHAMLGGTLPYMSPEHLDAFDPKGCTRPDAVDERADLYSLGLILFEMIAGQPAFESPPTSAASLPVLRKMIEERKGSPAPSLRHRCPLVPPSLDALVTKCLDPVPDRRHASAGDLAEDLRRFLDDLPMRHGPEPSLIERATKWTRRHPALCGTTSIAVAAVVTIGLLGFATAQAYEGMQGLHSRLKLRMFQHDIQECRFLLNTFGNDDARIRRGLALAASTLGGAGAADFQHTLGTKSAPPGTLGGGWISRLGANEQGAVRASIVELMLQSIHAQVILASRHGDVDQQRAVLKAAVARLDSIEYMSLAAPSVLFRQRAHYRAALGDAGGAAGDLARALSQPPSTSHGWMMLGTFMLASGDLMAAEQALREALARDVTSFWAWFALGHCHFEQSRFPEAVGDFTACVVARPEFAWAHFNRGLALARAGRPRDAKDAFDRALALDADFVEARVDRGLVELELGQAVEAETDLRGGVARGRQEPAVLAALGDAMIRQGKDEQAERLFRDLFARAPDDVNVRVARGITRLRTNPAAAGEDFALVLASKPGHALANYGMARVLRPTDREAALAHLDRALKADPGLLDALELRALERARAGDRGALYDIDRLIKNPTANRLYNAACSMAILGEKFQEPAYLAHAVDLLEMSLKIGFPISHAMADDDLASLRNRKDYNDLVRPHGGTTSE